MIVGWVTSSGAAEVRDTWSSSLGKPANDASQDVRVLSASESGGATRLRLARKLDTGDARDVALGARPLLVQWAYHGADDYDDGPTHDRWGSLALNLLGAGGPPLTVPPTPAPTPAPAAELRADGFAVDGGRFAAEWSVDEANALIEVGLVLWGWGVGQIILGSRMIWPSCPKSS